VAAPGRPFLYTDEPRPSKAVVTSRPLNLAAWSNSAVVSEPVEDWLAYVQRATDVVVIGSTRLVERLMTAELVDEYRLLTFPTAIGQGRRLFTKPTVLQLVSSQAGEHTVLTILRPEGASA
jgi:dihydrofolate reductase